MFRWPRLRSTIGMGCILFLTVSQAHAADVSPDAFIQQMYKHYVSDGKRPAKGLPLNKKEDYRRYFSTGMADLFYADRTGHPGEVGLIDFDPIICAQDFDIKHAPQLQTTRPERERAIVSASFTNNREKMVVSFALVKTAAGWRMDDITCPQSKSSLMEALKAGHFED